jgi:hypothetical protein
MWRLPTSISKLIRGIHHEKSTLDETKSAKEDFQKAADKGEDGRGIKPKAPELAGSRMIRDHAPALEMKPAGQMRQVPDRFAAARKLEAERREAEERNRQARMAETARALAARREGRENALEVETPSFGNPRPEPEAGEKTPSQESLEQAWARFNQRQQELDRDDRERER